MAYDPKLCPLSFEPRFLEPDEEGGRQAQGRKTEQRRSYGSIVADGGTRAGRSSKSGQRTTSNIGHHGIQSEGINGFGDKDVTVKGRYF